MATGSPQGFIDSAKAHLAAIVESSEDAIISKTLEGKILTWNTGAERVYGYTPAEAIGQPMTLLLPDDRPDEEAGILESIRRGQRVRALRNPPAQSGRRFNPSFPDRLADSRP